MKNWFSNKKLCIYVSFSAFLAHRSQTFRGPNSVKEKGNCPKLLGKSRIFEISIEIIFVTIGHGKVKNTTQSLKNICF